MGWVVLGYFSFFDLGLGRALTKLTSEYLGKDQPEKVADVFWTGSLLMFLIGIAGLSISLTVNPIIVGKFLNISPDLVEDANAGFNVLSFSIPIVILTAGFRGFLESFQRFRLLTWIRIPLGISTFALPLLVLPMSNKISSIFLALLLVRLINAVVHFFYCIQTYPRLKSKFQAFKGVLWKKMLSFGGWMTVSNILSPLMVYIDRFFIGGLLTMAFVTYYTTPYEIITKLLIIPSAFAGVLFPAFSSTYNTNAGATFALFRKGVKFLFLILFPIITLFLFFGGTALSLWLGNEFETHSTLVLQVLVVGILYNSLAFLSFSLIQATGRPDITAKIHLIEFPVYIFSVWYLTKYFGITGTAIAWTGRVILDAIISFAAIQLYIDDSKKVFSHFLLLFIPILLVLPILSIADSPYYRFAALLLIFAAFSLVTLKFFISKDEINFLNFKSLSLKHKTPGSAA